MFKRDKTYYIKKAEYLYEIKKFEKALNPLYKAINLDKNDHNLYKKLGNVYAELKNYNKAIVYYSKSIEQKEDYSEAYYNRSLIYEEIKNYILAINDMTVYIKHNPNDYESYYFRGRLYLMIEKIEKAYDDLSVSIKISPTFEAYNLRAIAYFYEKKFEKALSDYKSAYELDSEKFLENVDCCEKIGLSLLLLKSPKKNIKKWLMKAAELNSDNRDVYCFLGHYYLSETNNYSKAIEYYEKAIRYYEKANTTDNEHAKVFFNLGISYLEKGNLQTGIREIEKAFKLNPMLCTDQAKELLSNARKQLQNQKEYEEKKKAILIEKERQQKEHEAQIEAMKEFIALYQSVHGIGAVPCLLFRVSPQVPPCINGRPFEATIWSWCDSTNRYCPRYAEYLRNNSYD